MKNLPKGPFSMRYEGSLNGDTYLIQNHQGTVARIHFEWPEITGSAYSTAQFILDKLNSADTHQD